MQISRNVKEEIPFISLQGDIEPQDASSIKNIFNELIRKGEFNFVLELGQISSLHVEGLSSIVGGYTTLRKHNGSLKLLSPSPAVRSVLKRAGLSNFFEIFEDEYEALFSFPT